MSASSTQIGRLAWRLGLDARDAHQGRRDVARLVFAAREAKRAGLYEAHEGMRALIDLTDALEPFNEAADEVLPLPVLTEEVA